MNTFIRNNFTQNNFGVAVYSQNMPAEKFVYQNKNFLKLPKNSVYSIQVTNNNNVKADVYITLNNKKLGVWRINPYSKITLDNNNNHLDFILTHDNTDFKLVFKPEKFSSYEPPANQVQLCENSMMYCKKYTDSFVASEQMSRPCLMNSDKYDEYIAMTLAPGLRKKEPIKDKIVKPLEDIDTTHIETIEFSLMMTGTVYLEKPSFQNIKYTSRYIYP